jgi:hypothetical protein
MSMSMSMLIERGDVERADRDGTGPERWTMLIAGTMRSSCGRLGPMARRGRAEIKHTHTCFSRRLEGSRAAHQRVWAFILRVIWGTDIKDMKIEYAFLRSESDRVAARPRALLHDPRRMSNGSSTGLRISRLLQGIDRIWCVKPMVCERWSPKSVSHVTPHIQILRPVGAANHRIGKVEQRSQRFTMAIILRVQENDLELP